MSHRWVSKYEGTSCTDGRVCVSRDKWPNVLKTEISPPNEGLISNKEKLAPPDSEYTQKYKDSQLTEIYLDECVVSRSRCELYETQDCTGFSIYITAHLNQNKEWLW